MSDRGSDGRADPFALPRHEGTSKVMPLRDAVARFVDPGDTVHVAYSDARPNAALLELVRRFSGRPADLTLVTAGVVSSQHALVETGVVNRVLASFAGENYPSPKPNPAFQRAVADGRVTVENWSLWGLTARLVAGALGVPFFPVRSLRGSSLATEHAGRDYREIEDPMGGLEPVGVVSALRPDVVLLQGVAADRHGNVVMAAPYGESHWGALAARKGAVVCVERVVDTEDIRRHAALVRIPGHAVAAVCEVPYGSHPYGLYNPGFPGVAGYTQDEAFMAEVYRASRTPEGFRAWIDEWVLGVDGHAGYLAKLGRERLATLAEQPVGDPWPSGDGDSGAHRWNDHELLVVAAARQVVARVSDAGHDAVLAGVGLANLAAWLGVSTLKREAVDVELMAEIGMFGYSPRPGEPFIFSTRTLPTCKYLGDVMTILGTFVGGPGTRSLGVIGAAQVDLHGNANSTYTADGEFLVGSGGANDIASSSHEVLVVVPHGRSRLVESLPYVTSPGTNVRTIVTSAAVFERDGGRYLLTRYLPRRGESRREALERIVAGCGWEFDLASDLRAEPDPTPQELRLVRAFDPQRIFLDRRRKARAGEVAPS